MEQKSSDHYFNLISLQEEGLALLRDNDKFEEGKKIWDLIVLDTALQQLWDSKFKIENRFTLIGNEYVSGNLYLLYKTGDANINTLQLVSFSLSTHEYITQEIKLQVEFKLTHFSVCKSTVILGGYIIKEPAVFLFSIEEKQLKVVPGFFLKDTELLDLRVNHNNTFNVLMMERGSGMDEKKLVLRTFDASGAMLLEELIPIDKKKTILSGMTSSLINDEMIIAGTYSTNATSKQASGFYSTIIDPFSSQPVYYTDLPTLDHFTDYLGEKRALKAKHNAKVQRQRGREPQFKNEVSLIRIHEMSKGFLLLAEIYNSNSNLNNGHYWNNYPYNYGYGMNPYGVFFPYGSRYYNTPYSYNNPQNLEVKMQEGVLLFFDHSGKIGWDQSLKFDNIKYPGLEQTSDFIEQSDRFLLAYKKKSDIWTKTTVLYDQTFKLDTIKIQLQNELDIVRNESEEDGGLRYWFKNHFYVWGYQTLRNQALKTDDRVRHVFYINKISAE